MAAPHRTWDDYGRRVHNPESNSMLRKLPDHDRPCHCEACKEVRAENRIVRTFMGW